LPFWCQTRPETITEEKIKLVEGAGAQSISVGVESGSPEMRKLLNRPMSNKLIINAFEILNKTNLRVCANNIIGIPDETREHIFETIGLNRKLNRKLGKIRSMVHIFTPYKGTKFYNLCIQKGYIKRL